MKKKLFTLGLTMLCIMAFVFAGCASNVTLLDFEDKTIEVDYGSQFELKTVVTDENGQVYSVTAEVTEKETGEAVIAVNNKIDILSAYGYTIVYTAHVGSDTQTCTVTLTVIDDTIPDIRFGQAAAYGELNTPYQLPAYEVKDAVSQQIEESVRLYRTEDDGEVLIDADEYAEGTFLPTVGGDYTYEVTATDQSGNTRVGKFEFYIRIFAPQVDEVESFDDACALGGVKTNALTVQPYSNDAVQGVTNYLALKYADVGGYATFSIRGRYSAEYYLDRGYEYLSYMIYVDPETVTERTKKFETLDGKLLEVVPGTWQEVFVDFSLIEEELTDADGAETIRLIKNTLNDNEAGRVHDGDMVFCIADVKFRKNEVSGNQLVNPLGDVADKHIASSGVSCVTEEIGGIAGSFSIDAKAGTAFAVAPVNASVLEGNNRVSFKVYAAGTGEVGIALATGDTQTVACGEWKTFMVTASVFNSAVAADGYGDLFTIRSISGDVTAFYVSEIEAYREDAPSVEIETQDSLGIVGKEFILPVIHAVDADGNVLSDDHITVSLKDTDTQKTFTPADGKFTPDEPGSYEFAVTVSDNGKSAAAAFTFYVSAEAVGLHADANAEAYVTTSENVTATYVENYDGKAALKLDIANEQWPPVNIMPQRPKADFEGYDTFVLTLRIDSASFGTAGRTSRVFEIAGRSMRVPLDQWFMLSLPITDFYDGDGIAISKKFFNFWMDAAHKSYLGCEPDTFSLYIAGMDAVKKGETLTGNDLLDFSNIAVLDHFKPTNVDQWGASTHAFYIPEFADRQNVVGLYVSGTMMAWQFNLPDKVSEYAYIEMDIYVTTTLDKQYLCGVGNYALKQNVEVVPGTWTKIYIPVSDYLNADSTASDVDKMMYKKIFLANYYLDEPYNSDANWFICIGGVRGVMRDEPELELTEQDSLGIVNKTFTLPTFTATGISGNPITGEDATIVLKNLDTDTTISNDIVDGAFIPTQAGNYQYSVTVTDGGKSVTKTFTFYVSAEAVGLHADANAEAYVTTSENVTATYVENYDGKAALKLDIANEQWPPVNIMPQRPKADFEGYDTFVLTLRIDSASFGTADRTSRVLQLNANDTIRVPLDQWFTLSLPIADFYGDDGNAISVKFFNFWMDRAWPGCELDTFSLYIAGMDAVKKGETLTGNDLLDFSSIAVLDHFKPENANQWGNSTHAIYIPELAGRQNVVGLFVTGTGMGWAFNLPESVNGYDYIEIDVCVTTTLDYQYLVGHGNYAVKTTQKLTSGEWTTIRISVSDYNSAQTINGRDNLPYKKIFLTTFELNEDPYKSDVNWLVCIGGVRGVNETDVTE